MQVFVSRKFLKNFERRFGHLENVKKKFDERLDVFKRQPDNPILNDHQLKWKRTDCRSFSITGDVRVIYYVKDNIAYFLDIGTHNQVY